MISAVIVAGGTSSRFGKNKLNEDLLGKSVLMRSINALCNFCDELIVVGTQLENYKCVSGGETRSQSVLNGLKAVSKDCDIVVIHDGARPFVSRSLVSSVIASAKEFGSGVPRLAVTDTLYCNSQSVDRNEFFIVQTPQAFNYAKLMQSFELQGNFTDESTRYAKCFGSVHFVEGQHSNTKVTYPEDLSHFSVGNGFDVHAFESGDGVILGGVKIPFDKKLKGHSDADVLLHAICDAVLSGSNNRDIGVQFPDSDDTYKGIDSAILLKSCVEKAKQNGYEVLDVSAVVICQAPKLMPHLERIMQNVADILDLPLSSVNISATTTEKLGALGNGDGVACQAVVLLSNCR